MYPLNKINYILRQDFNFNTSCADCASKLLEQLNDLRIHIYRVILQDHSLPEQLKDKIRAKILLIDLAITLAQQYLDDGDFFPHIRHPDTCLQI